MNALVLQSDFGLMEGTVAQMYGVSLQVHPELRIYDLAHNIPKFDTWSASYALYQTIPTWPSETVFVSVVDPGVGSDRKSVVAKTDSAHYIVTPNNGTLTLIARRIGIVAMHEIDEKRHRRAHTEHIHVFHGRDVYSYTGAKLAAGIIALEDVGAEMALSDIQCHDMPEPCLYRDRIEGILEIDDPLFGMLWSNIPHSMLQEFEMCYGERYAVTIHYQGTVKYSGVIQYVKSFAYVEKDEDLLYVNEIGNLAIASNVASFIEKHRVSYGSEWTIRITRHT